jgi:hypothetical protein
MKHLPRLHSNALRSKSKRVISRAILSVKDETLWLVGFLISFSLSPFRLAREFFFGLMGSPRATYYAIRDTRDWILAKVSYLQEESEKWRRVFQIIKSPYSVLRAMGFSPQMAGTFLFASTAVTSTVVVNEVMEGKSFSAGDSGVYTAPLDIPTEYYDDDNTLRVDLGSTPIGLLQIENVTVGTAYANSALPSGESSVVIVGGLPTVSDPAFTETYLEVGHMTVDRWRCTTMTLANIEAHHLIVKQNASDGQSIAAVAGTPRARGIGGGNRADAMVTSGGYYDQLKITSATSGVNGKVDRLILSNLYTKGGACTLSRIKAGTLEIILNEIGSGDGFAAKDFTIATSVIYKSFTNEDNVEVSISPPS